MRKINLIILFAIVLLTACKDDTNFSIKGHISNADGEYVYLDKLKVSSAQAVDSVIIDEDGDFEFKGVVEYPTYYLLRLSPNNFITLLVDSTEEVNVQADAANFSREYEVTGSVGSEYVKELNAKLSDTKHSLDSISTYRMAMRYDDNYPTLVKTWDAEYDSVRAGQVSYSQNFIKQHPFSMANVLVLYQKFNDDDYVIQDLQSMRIAATALYSFYPESEHVQALYKNTQEIMKSEKKQSMNNFMNEYGVNSPDIVLPNQHGKKVALSSFRGKYVLVQFWSAESDASHIANTMLINTYAKFKNKNFTIYQVSVDTDEQAWKTAIKKDKLAWTNVGDMKGSNTAVMHYNVKRVPSNYLLDPEGNILAKNLNEEDLNLVLSKRL